MLASKIADGRTDLVFDLLAEGHPANSTDDEGVAIIRHCAYYGDTSAVRFLLSRGEKLESLGENYDLNGAAFHGHWQLCQFLIASGASVNHPLPDTGETPLHAALCRAGSVPHELVVRVLVAAGADPNRATIPGVETGGFMRDIRTRGETPLHRAAAFATARTIQSLLDVGAVRDARDANGDSPLTWASWHLRSAAILKLLCFHPHRIRQEAVEASMADRGLDLGDGMRRALLGTPHFE